MRLLPYRSFLLFLFGSLLVLPSCKPRGYQEIPGCKSHWLLDPKGAAMHAKPDRNSKVIKQVFYGSKLLVCGTIKTDTPGTGVWHYASSLSLKRAWIHSRQISKNQKDIDPRNFKMPELLHLYNRADGIGGGLIIYDDPETGKDSGNSFTINSSGLLRFHVSGIPARLIRIRRYSASIQIRIKEWKAAQKRRGYEIRNLECTLSRRTLERATRGLTKNGFAPMTCVIQSRQPTRSKPPEDF